MPGGPGGLSSADRDVGRLISARARPSDPRKAERYDLVFWLKTPKRTYFFSFSEPQRHEWGGPVISPDLDPRRAAGMDEYRLEDETERMRGHLSLEFDTFEPGIVRLGHSGDHRIRPPR